MVHVKGIETELVHFVATDYFTMGFIQIVYPFVLEKGSSLSRPSVVPPASLFRVRRYESRTGRQREQMELGWIDDDMGKKRKTFSI